MFDIVLTQENLIICGILFGLLMVSPLICSIISEACKGKNK